MISSIISPPWPFFYQRVAPDLPPGNAAAPSRIRRINLRPDGFVELAISGLFTSDELYDLARTFCRHADRAERVVARPDDPLGGGAA